MALGVAVPWIAVHLEGLEPFAATTLYEPLNAFAIGLLVLSLASLSGANEFLAAFVAGVTLATLSPAIRKAFHQFGELIAELLKLAALLLFGALISPSLLAELAVRGYVFAALALVAVRPVALGVALLGARSVGRSGSPPHGSIPRGWFVSVVYGLLILESGIARRDELFHLIVVVIVLSIVAHASSDVPVARWFRENAHIDESPPGPQI